MSKRKSSTSVTVTFQGRGHNVKAYVLGKKAVSRLISATSKDALYEDNPFSMVGMLGVSVETVTLGFDPSKLRYVHCEVAIGAKKVTIDDIVFDDGEEPVSLESDSQLIVREDPGISLGRNLTIKKNESIVLEVIDMRDAILSASFDASDDFETADIALIASNLDYPSDLARSTYDLGLLNGMDQDIRMVRYGEKLIEFNLEILNSSQSAFYLCQRVSDDQWEAKFLG